MTQRSHLMDGLRVLAAHVIVLHHLSSYGPLAEMLALASPWVHEVLFHYGRYATQLFLVMAGFLAAQDVLRPHPAGLGKRILGRYRRLVPPFALALLTVALVVEVLRPWIHQAWLTEPSSLWQWITHVLLIHDLVHQPAMTVGAWYVAIDFQLFVLLAVWGWGMRRAGGSQGLTVAGVALLCLASQWYFNRHDEWDRWAVFFFESYGAGALLSWALSSQPVAKQARVWLGVCLVSALIAGWVYPRPRLWLTVLVCGMLYLGVQRWQPAARWSNWLQRQSDTSYALFLTHFAPLVLANALWIRSGSNEPAWGVTVLVLTWLACVPWSVMFHRSVETLMEKVWRR